MEPRALACHTLTWGSRTTACRPILMALDHGKMNSLGPGMLQKSCLLESTTSSQQRTASGVRCPNCSRTYHLCVTKDTPEVGGMYVRLERRLIKGGDGSKGGA